ncbi:HNH endonuclease [Methylobacterium sp. JK268]
MPSLKYGIKQSEWKQLRLRVLARDGYRCTYCGSSRAPLQCDHIVPFTRGGTNDCDNLTTACGNCNRSKGNRPLETWAGPR